jgi:integrase/recombinase XerD
MADAVVLQGLSDDLLRVAIATHLARYKGLSRVHTSSDLQVFLRWCADRQLDPLRLGGPTSNCSCGGWKRFRRFKPSTVSRRLSVVTCFYRTCVIYAIVDASPAAYVRRPPVPNESPTLGLSYLQFETMIVTARTSTIPLDFALVAMLGLLGLRVFEACSASIDDLGEEHGHHVLRVLGKETKRALIPLPPANTAGGRMPRTYRHMLRHPYVTTMLDAGVSLRDVQIAARHANPKTTMRYDRARKNLDRHPNYILAAYMASGT